MSPILEEEAQKIRDLVNTPALDWSQFHGYKATHHRQFSSTSRPPRMSLLAKKLPPFGYVCKRCGLQGHFIQYCPTNGDPNYDIKNVYVRPHTPKVDEAAFEEKIGFLKKKKSVESVNVAPEFMCSLCKKAMKDAVMSKCCLESFCDKCIRDYLISSKLNCVCGASGVLTDYLIPNMAVRGLINRMFLESDNGEKIVLDAEERRAKKARTDNHVCQAKNIRLFQGLASPVY